jgi:hypothetical protein
MLALLSGSVPTEASPVFVLIRFFIDMLLHRSGPAELPRSRFLLWLLVSLGACVEFGSLLLRVDAALSTAIVIVTTLLDLAFVWSVLHAFGLHRRFAQTMTALAGTNTIINALYVPLTLASKGAAAESGVLFWSAVQILFVLWAIDVAGFVIARALDRPYAFGVVIMLGYALLQLSLVSSMIPVFA